MPQKIDYVICLPGDPKNCIQANASEMMRVDLMRMGKTFMIRRAQSCNIYTVRNGCLAPTGQKKHQTPFNGEFEYDRMIWIDSDNVFESRDIMQLLTHDVDIVAGWYRQSIFNTRVASGWWNKETGRIDPMFEEKMETYPVNENGLVEVDYAGMGLMIVKYGVFESMTYPWFHGHVYEWEEDGVAMADNENDDDCFCRRAKEAGNRIYIDPVVKVLHQKLATI